MGDGNDKLLGVPKLASGTGLNEFKAVYDLVEQWKLTNKIAALSFDTTSVNTGRSHGVCTRLENAMGRELLWLACCHHVMELILAKIFTLCCGPSSSPYIPIFKRFKAAWSGVMHGNFRGLDEQPGTDKFRTSALELLRENAGKVQIRDDYQELLELTMTVLGHPPTKIHWRSPGKVHRARWMAKLIYAIKIYWFRDQRNVFNLTKMEEKHLHRFVQFGALLYTKAWTEAPLAAEAPGRDLAFWIDLGKYQATDPEIGLAARKVLENHLWYLSDDAVGLALFSDRVPLAEKMLTVECMAREFSIWNVRGNAVILKKGVKLGTVKLMDRLQIGKYRFLLFHLSVGVRMKTTCWEESELASCKW